MQIFCPKCQAQLGLPDDAAGKKARCPSCQEVFRVSADHVGPAENVQVALPPRVPIAPSPPSESGPVRAYDEPPPSRRRRDDDDRPVRRRRDDEDEDDERPVRRRRRGDDDEADDDGFGGDQRAARTKARRSAHVMRASAIAYLLAIGANIVITLLAIQTIAVPQNVPDAQSLKVGQYLGAIVCWPTIHISLLVAIWVGANRLAQLDSRGIVITGIVMSFVSLCFFGIGAVVNLISLFLPIPDGGRAIIVAQVSLYSLMALALLVGGIMGIVALVDPDVQAEYARRRR